MKKLKFHYSIKKRIIRRDNPFFVSTSENYELTADNFPQKINTY